MDTSYELSTGIVGEPVLSKGARNRRNRRLRKLESERNDLTLGLSTNWDYNRVLYTPGVEVRGYTDDNAECGYEVIETGLSKGARNRRNRSLRKLESERNDLTLGLSTNWDYNRVLYTPGVEVRGYTDDNAECGYEVIETGLSKGARNRRNRRLRKLESERNDLTLGLSTNWDYNRVLYTPGVEVRGYTDDNAECGYEVIETGLSKGARNRRNRSLRKLESERNDLTLGLSTNWDYNRVLYTPGVEVRGYTDDNAECGYEVIETGLSKGARNRRNRSLRKLESERNDLTLGLSTNWDYNRVLYTLGVEVRGYTDDNAECGYEVIETGLSKGARNRRNRSLRKLESERNDLTLGLSTNWDYNRVLYTLGVEVRGYTDDNAECGYEVIETGLSKGARNRRNRSLRKLESERNDLPLGLSTNWDYNRVLYTLGVEVRGYTDVNAECGYEVIETGLSKGARNRRNRSLRKLESERNDLSLGLSTNWNYNRVLYTLGVEVRGYTDDNAECGYEVIETGLSKGARNRRNRSLRKLESERNDLTLGLSTNWDYNRVLYTLGVEVRGYTDDNAECGYEVIETGLSKGARNRRNRSLRKLESERNDLTLGLSTNWDYNRVLYTLGVEVRGYTDDNAECGYEVIETGLSKGARNRRNRRLCKLESERNDLTLGLSTNWDYNRVLYTLGVEVRGYTDVNAECGYEVIETGLSKGARNRRNRSLRKLESERNDLSLGLSTNWNYNRVLYTLGVEVRGYTDVNAECGYEVIETGLSKGARNRRNRSLRKLESERNDLSLGLSTNWDYNRVLYTLGVEVRGYTDDNAECGYEMIETGLPNVARYRRNSRLGKSLCESQEERKEKNCVVQSGSDDLVMDICHSEDNKTESNAIRTDNNEESFVCETAVKTVGIFTSWTFIILMLFNELAMLKFGTIFVCLGYVLIAALVYGIMNVIAKPGGSTSIEELKNDSFESMMSTDVFIRIHTFFFFVFGRILQFDDGFLITIFIIIVYHKEKWRTSLFRHYK